KMEEMGEEDWRRTRDIPNLFRLSLMYFSLCVSLSLCLSLFAYFSLCVSLPLCLSLFIYFSLCVSLSLCLSLFFVSPPPVLEAAGAPLFQYPVSAVRGRQRQAATAPLPEK